MVEQVAPAQAITMACAATHLELLQEPGDVRLQPVSLMNSPRPISGGKQTHPEA